jgi:hypothetical protein
MTPKQADLSSSKTIKLQIWVSLSITDTIDHLLCRLQAYQRTTMSTTRIQGKELPGEYALSVHLGLQLSSLRPLQFLTDPLEVWKEYRPRGSLLHQPRLLSLSKCQQTTNQVLPNTSYRFIERGFLTYPAEFHSPLNRSYMMEEQARPRCTNCQYELRSPRTATYFGMIQRKIKSVTVLWPIFSNPE